MKMLRSSATALTLCTLLAPAPVQSKPKTSEEVLAEAESYTLEIDVTNEIGLNVDEGGDASGTGFLVDKNRGWVITNAHVATRSPASIKVSFNGDGTVTAKRIHVDPVIDVAILEVNKSDIPVGATEAPLDCSSLPIKGAEVLAYGHPKGFKYTGSRGIISGFTDKYLPSHFIMTDAQIDSGSSGGPLIRSDDGKVVGINTASSKSEKLSISFAEPMPPVCRILEQLKAGKSASVNHLNIGIARKKDEQRPIVGVIYGDQPELKQGDLILEVNGSGPVESYADLLDRLRGVGQSVKLTIERNAAKHTVTAKTYPAPDPLAAKAVNIAGAVISEPWALDDQQVNGSYNLRVHFIDYAKEAGHSEATIGSRVVSVDGREFHSSEALYRYLKGLPKDAKAKFVLRGEISSDQIYFGYKIIELPVEGVELLEAKGTA